MMDNSELLVVSHQYNHFVKDQVDELANYYRAITVVVRYNRIASLADYLPIDYLNLFSRSRRINRADQPDNVTVIPMPITYLPTDFSRRRLGDRHAKRLRRILRNRDISFDLVHSHFTWTAGYAGQIVSEEFDVPHIMTVHENTDSLSKRLESGNEDLHWALENTDQIVRVSHTDLEKLREYNPSTVVVPNGYEVNRFEPIKQEQARRHLGIDPEIQLLFSLGNLTERKGFHNVISILPQLNENQTVTYAIGGHGPKKDDYLQQARDLGIQSQLQLLDYVPNDELKYWMNAADLFVFPSYSESFGVVQIEAMACGTPVVACVNGGSEHLIISDEYGFLVDDSENLEELHCAVKKGLTKEWEREAIVDYAQQYTIPAVCKQIADLHAELLKT